MKYSIMRPKNNLPPWEQEVDLYIIPVSENAEYYLVLSPAALKKGREYTLLRQSINLRTYEGCPEGVIRTVGETLSGELKGREEKFTSRMRIFFTIGVVSFVLGLINMFIPDPLPYIDEAVLLIGGGLIAGLSGFILNRQSGPFRNCINGIIENIQEAVLIEDPVLTTVYRAIRSKAHPSEARAGEETVDEIERESAWLVTHLNISAMLQDGSVGKKRFFDFIRILSRSLGLRRSRKRTEKLGLDEHAETVYEELFARAREIFEESGEKFP